MPELPGGGPHVLPLTSKSVLLQAFLVGLPYDSVGE